MLLVGPILYYIYPWNINTNINDIELCVNQPLPVVLFEGTSKTNSFVENSIFASMSLKLSNNIESSLSNKYKSTINYSF